jgi:hypothetical protein
MFKRMFGGGKGAGGGAPPPPSSAAPRNTPLSAVEQLKDVRPAPRSRARTALRCLESSRASIRRPRASPAPPPRYPTLETLKHVTSTDRQNNRDDTSRHHSLQTLAMLEKREALLHKKMAAELQKAKEFNRQKKKSAALQCLKKKKLYETQIENLQNHQLKLEEQVITLEGSKTTAETFSALKNGAGAMKQISRRV